MRTRIQGFDDQQYEKILTAKNFYFLYKKDKKLQFIYLQAI